MMNISNTKLCHFYLHIQQHRFIYVYNIRLSIVLSSTQRIFNCTGFLICASLYSADYAWHILEHIHLLILRGVLFSICGTISHTLRIHTQIKYIVWYIKILNVFWRIFEIILIMFRNQIILSATKTE